MQEEQEELLLDTGINTIPEEDSVSFKQELGVMWSICWPVALSSFCRLVMALTDVSVLGHLGTDYLAGCALAWVWMDITLTFVWSLADSLSTLCSQAYGAKNYLLVGKWLQIGLLATAIGSIPVGLSWGYVSRILQGLGVDKSSADIAQVFSQWSIFWILPDCWYYGLRQYFQAQGIVMPALTNNMIFVFVNLGLNVLLVHGVSDFHGRVLWSGMGYIGSPIATSISRILQLFFFWLYTCAIKKLHQKTWPPFEWETFSCNRISKFCKVGVPTTFGNAIESWQLQVITLFASKMGRLQVATMSGVFQVFTVLHCFAFGLAKATNVRVGFHLGAGKAKLAKQASLVSISMAFVIGAIVTIVLIATRQVAGKIYSSDPQVWELHSKISVFTAIGYLGVSLLISFTATLLGQARPLWVVLIGFICAWGISVPLAWFLGLRIHMGIRGLWIALCVGYGMFSLLTGIVVATSSWEKCAEQALKRSEATEQLLYRKEDEEEQ